MIFLHIKSYCWWFRNPANHLLSMKLYEKKGYVLCVSTGAGFLLSTVFHQPGYAWNKWIYLPKRYQVVWGRYHLTKWFGRKERRHVAWGVGVRGRRYIIFPKNPKHHRNWASMTGCFLKLWYPRNTPKWSFLVGKPWLLGTTILGNPHWYMSWMILQVTTNKSSPKTQWCLCFLERPGG